MLELILSGIVIFVVFICACMEGWYPCSNDYGLEDNFAGVKDYFNARIGDIVRFSC